MRNNNYCQLHTDKQIEFVCTTKHYCKKRFCSRCFNQHTQENIGQTTTFLLIDNFFSLLKQNYNVLEAKQSLQKEILQSTQQQFQMLFENTRNAYKTLYDDAQLINNEFQGYKNKLLNGGLENFSDEEFSMLLNSLNPGFLQYINEQNRKINETLIKINQFLEKFLKKSQNIIQNFTQKTKTVQIFKYHQFNLKLIGQQLFGLNHGDFYYEIDQVENSKILAGTYKFNKKIKLWKEMVYDEDRNQLHWEYVKYEFGQRQQLFKFSDNKMYYCSNNSCLPGDINQYGERQGTWIVQEQDSLYQSFYNLGKNCGKHNMKLKNQNQNFSDSWGGQFDRNGDKTGLWIENWGRVQKVGLYEKSLETKDWKIYFENELIGGGSYNDGIKTGFWKEIDNQNFTKQNQIYFEGNYEKGHRVGYWTIRFFAQVIGGGNYDLQGAKVGQWKEINVFNFKQDCQIFYQGQYDDGQKIGQWQIYLQETQIGGGEYKKDETKNGNWRDIDWQYFGINNQLIYSGIYKDGLKVGKWNIELQNQIIGGGEYDQNERKLGRWREVDRKCFCFQNQIIYEGSYKDGNRIGQWIIEINNEKRGGGTYNLYGKKIGIWREMEAFNFNKYNFRDDFFVLEGEYKDDQKTGLWKILLMENLSTVYQISYQGQYIQNNRIGNWTICINSVQIGGGCYDENGAKNGVWRELDEQFYTKDSQVTFSGYYLNDVRVGKWNIEYCSEIVGGGEYNNYGHKTGQWVDINLKYFKSQSKIFFSGIYQNNIETGYWTIYYEKEKIGGGQFRKGVKIGFWKEIDLDFFCWKCQIFTLGLMAIMAQKLVIGGGGKYDENGQKFERWRELDQKYYSRDLQIFYEGSYEKGIRIGVWRIEIYTNSGEKCLFTGGGFYNQGIKNGIWREVDTNLYSIQTEIFIIEGEYNLSGKKIGKWNSYTIF